MPFLTLILLVPVFLVPLATHQMYQAAFDCEKAQISVDNQGILLGRRDRAILNALVKVNKVVANLDLVHDGFHACARVPYTAAFCEPIDVGMEFAIKGFLQAARVAALVGWTASGVQSSAGISNRPLALKLKAKRCKLCQQDFQWELENEKPIYAHLRETSKHRLDVYTHLHGEDLHNDWNYSLALDPPAKRSFR